MENTRRIALETLLEAEKEKVKSDRVFHAVLDKYSYLEKQELSFLSRLLNGTLERKLELDYIIGSFSSVKVEKLKPVIRMILRLGVYELLYMDAVPEGATVNEAVKLCEKKGFRGLKGFVNGVLRSVSRNKAAIVYPDKATAPIEYLSVRYSVPAFIVKKLTNAYGEEIAEAVCRAQLESRPVFIRTNESWISKEELQRYLNKEGIQTEPAPYIQTALQVKEPDRIAASQTFQEGLFGISDLSSMLAVSLAGIRNGDQVLDICAAPGGKTCHVLDILRGSGEVISRDISERKTELIRENVTRQRFTGNIRIEEADALVYDAGLYERFDVVIADLPCTGLGVMGRKKDIKYRLREEDFTTLADLQRKILSVAISYIKPGGTLLYSTCTIDRCENEDNFRYIATELGLKPVPLTKALPRELLCESAEEGYIQLLPGVHASDGFFIARFQKREGA